MSAEFVMRLLRDDKGQDLIEYGILTGIVIATGVIIFTTINTKMGAAYDDWGTQIQDNWEPLPPTVTP